MIIYLIVLYVWSTPFFCENRSLYRMYVLYLCMYLFMYHICGMRRRMVCVGIKPEHMSQKTYKNIHRIKIKKN